MSFSNSNWSPIPLSDLAPEPLTRLSASLLRSAAERALRRFWEDLAIPPPEEPQLAIREGRLCLNIAAQQQAMAKLLGTADFLPWPDAGIPSSTRSLRARWQAHRARNRFLDYLNRLAQEGPSLLDTLRRWWQYIQGVHWTQADLLQAMEEVELFFARGLHLLFTAEWGLAWMQAHGIQIMPPTTEPEDVIMAKALWHAANEMQPLDAFLEKYGHRAANELELARPRWREDPTPLQAVRHALQDTPFTLNSPASATPQGPRETLASTLWSLRLEARAALGFAADATRTWVLAAAQEAMADERLRAPEEVFRLELEEVKQLLTGEWNVRHRSEIRQLLDQRQEETTTPTHIPPPAMTALTSCWAPVQGTTTGPARVLCSLQEASRVQPGDVLILPSADPAWGLLFPVARAVIISEGSPYSAAALLAQVWRIPCVVHVPEAQAALHDGQPVIIDGTTITVTASSPKR